ncbi:hypothetical protein [Marinovum sp.]|uniref:hypothetical protein n=1 Tax=Marinovum sp. TaxID=2024839 RepID=UPI002B2776FD|nr:hypothetical protein [Marinovum sp.]
MSSNNDISRRGFVVTQVAGAATLAALPAGTTFAAVAPTPAAVPHAGPFNWHSSGAEELTAHLGRRFRFRAEDGQTAVLKLVAVEPVNSGPHRPADLPRKSGVIAVFDGLDKGPLVDAGSRTYRVSAARIGSADLMATPVRKRDGSDVIEIVLN